jgi:hypothetical protein
MDAGSDLIREIHARADWDRLNFGQVLETGPQALYRFRNVLHKFGCGRWGGAACRLSDDDKVEVALSRIEVWAKHATDREALDAGVFSGEVPSPRSRPLEKLLCQGVRRFHRWSLNVTTNTSVESGPQIDATRGAGDGDRTHGRNKYTGFRGPSQSGVVQSPVRLQHSSEWWSGPNGSGWIGIGMEDSGVDEQTQAFRQCHISGGVGRLIRLENDAMRDMRVTAVFVS